MNNNDHKIKNYKIQSYFCYNGNLDLFLDYIEFSGLNFTINTFLVFKFENSMNLYKLLTLSNNLDLIENLKKDNILIKQNNEYYLTNSAMLGLF